MNIELPFPAKVLWPNGRTLNHGYRAAEVRKHRLDAWKAMKAVLPPCFKHNGDPITLTWTIHPKPRGKVPDKDNCVGALKSYQDGIANALGVDDGVFGTPVILIGERRKGGAVEVTI